MNDLKELIETAERLSNRLSQMAENEKQFGYEMCRLLEQISYDTYKTGCEIRELSNYMIGDVA